MRIRYMVIFALFISIILSAALILTSKEIFVVKNIVIDKDFNLNNEKFIKYLDLKPDKYIWSYDIKEMKLRLSKQIFLDEYDIKKRYPDTLVIFLRIKKPIAKVVTDNNIMFIDKKGVIFTEVEDENNLPLLNFKIKKELTYGTILEKKYTKIIDILLDLKNKNSNIYMNIESINIVDNNNNLKYYVKYKGINENIYLKNFINVDLLKKGLVLSLYLKENNIERKDPYYAGPGFAY